MLAPKNPTQPKGLLSLVAKRAQCCLREPRGSVLRRYATAATAARCNSGELYRCIAKKGSHCGQGSHNKNGHSVRK